MVSRELRYLPNPTRQRLDRHMGVTIMVGDLVLRPASAMDEPFLLQLRELTMTEHLERVGEPSSEDSHYRRIRHHYEDARIVCRGPEVSGC
jgi:hypothetical protein